MSKAAAGLEIVIIIGVIVAVGIALVQLRGILVGESRISQAEVIYSFARELEGIVDRAIANTGDVNFVYSPPIKKYTVNISSVVKEKTTEEKKVNLDALKRKLIKEIHKEIQFSSASVRNDICHNQEIYGNSSFNAELESDFSSVNIESAIKNALQRINESYLINFYSVSDVIKKEITLTIDFCFASATTISYYDYDIRFTTSYGDFSISSIELYNASFKTRYFVGEERTVGEGENVTISQLQFSSGPIIKSYKQQDVKIIGPASYYQSSIKVTNLDNNVKSCRAGIYCGGGDCGGITFGHFVYNFEPNKEVVLNFYPEVTSGDLIIFCDDGSYYRRHIDFTKTEPDEPEKDEKIVEIIKKTMTDSTSEVRIYDKLSKKETSFSKSYNIVENYFEDCDKILVIKKDERLVITCRCYENGEKCSNDLLCCSGYCNTTISKCDMPPFCSQQSICPGAPTSGPGDSTWTDANGKTCCPLTNSADSGPICSNRHCCPSDKPKWCAKPKTGDPRCMDDNGIKNDCESVRICDGPLPDKFDWRNVNGKNFLPPIRNQGSCGSCWAFSAVGAVEGTYDVEQSANLNPDIAEQDLVSCSGAGSCGGGWPHSALSYVKSHGVCEESCFHYTAYDVACSSKCSDWSTRLWKIQEYAFVSNDLTEIKRALICHGPLSVAAMSWMHAIVLVGYDDNDSGGVWIIRNSWGTGWGDGGYGKIRYVGDAHSDIRDYVIYVKEVTSP